MPRYLVETPNGKTAVTINAVNTAVAFAMLGLTHEQCTISEVPSDYELCGTCGYDHSYDSDSPLER